MSARAQGGKAIKEGTIKDGKTIFLEQKCSNCHSVTSQGIKGLRPEGGAKPNDLSGEGDKFKTAWFEQWLMKTATLNNKKHMRKFRGTPEELHTLAKWLESLSIKSATK
jgi:mono/diheme cytochrome c family protein